MTTRLPRLPLILAAFALMPTEVTNEQYLAFIETTGAKPPKHWATASSAPKPSPRPSKSTS